MQHTILLADDSPTIRRLVVQTFSDGNYRVVEVNNGDSAIRAFEDQRPDVVLADIYMPGKSGYEVCIYVRHHPELGHTPVVLLVGAFEPFDEQMAKQAGATATITKPFEAGALLDLVRSVLAPTQDQAAVAAAAPDPDPAFAAVPAVAEAEAEPVPEPSAATDAEDLFGLASIFKEEPGPSSTAVLGDAEVDRIADRVMQKLSRQVIEGIAWEIVPEITERVVREELKRVK